ncbi:MAG: Gp138 family membrane-puncturing spike protein [Spirochaetales bacterium]|nr:Gp138 family membrane-puncturing spike protein [Spirochaetales bacterium]
MKETITDVLKTFMNALQDDLHTSLPGRIESYDAGSRTASIVPQMKKRYQAGEVLALPVIHNVPVQFPASGEASFSFPLKKGDEGWIMFSERSIDEWMDSGQAELPEDSRRFALDDAVFIPGTFSRKKTRAGSSNGVVAEFKKTKLEILEKEVVISFGGLTSIKFSESGGMEITHAGGKYSALSHLHNDAEQRPTTTPLPI